MCTGKYLLINVETMVSGHPIRWSMIVNMCILPDVDVSHLVTRSVAILSNGLSGISVINKG